MRNAYTSGYSSILAVQCAIKILPESDSQKEEENKVFLISKNSNLIWIVK